MILTFVPRVESGESDNKERGTVFECIDNVREDMFSVPVTSPALSESPVRR